MKSLIMAIVGGAEWLFIIIAVIVLLIWGPNQLPKLARAIGQAKKEFKKAQEEEEEKKEE